ncbi:MAG: DUF427 domain-containing protein [Acidimicrobiia bacterium]
MKGHTIDIQPLDAHVVVEIDGVRVAESREAVVLQETGLPPRYYLPREHVRADVLRATPKATECPFKGEASYMSIELDGGRTVENLVWVYEQPIAEAAAIAGRLAFFNEHVDLIVDGERQPRPDTPWS